VRHIPQPSSRRIVVAHPTFPVCSAEVRGARRTPDALSAANTPVVRQSEVVRQSYHACQRSACGAGESRHRHTLVDYEKIRCRQ